MTLYAFVCYYVENGQATPAADVLIWHDPASCQKLNQELEPPLKKENCDYPKSVKIKTDANGMALINIPESRTNHFWKFGSASKNSANGWRIRPDYIHYLYGFQKGEL
jgi:hypothetical protein